MTINKDQNTEQAILEAAEVEFLENGFAMAKTTEIAKRAGVNQALVHYYFRTKENLFNVVFCHKVRLLATSFLGITETDLPFFEKLEKQIETHFEFMRTNPRLPLFIINELTRNPERMKFVEVEFAAVAGNVQKRLKADMEVEVAKGTIRYVEPLELLLDVVSLNVFLFVGRPIIQVVTKTSDEQFKMVIEARKKEIVRVITDSLKIGK